MFLVYAIAYTNSTLNPLLYGGLNQVTCGLCRAFPILDGNLIPIFLFRLTGKL